MKCTVCGRETADNSVFCEKCGAKIEHLSPVEAPPAEVPAVVEKESKSTQQEKPTEVRKTGNHKLLIASIVIVALICIAGSFIIGKISGDKTELPEQPADFSLMGVWELTSIDGEGDLSENDFFYLLSFEEGYTLSVLSGYISVDEPYTLNYDSAQFEILHSDIDSQQNGTIVVGAAESFAEEEELIVEGGEIKVLWDGSDDHYAHFRKIEDAGPLTVNLSDEKFQGDWYNTNCNCSFSIDGKGNITPGVSDSRYEPGCSLGEINDSMYVYDSDNGYLQKFNSSQTIACKVFALSDYIIIEPYSLEDSGGLHSVYRKPNFPAEVFKKEN